MRLKSISVSTYFLLMYSSIFLLIPFLGIIYDGERVYSAYKVEFNYIVISISLIYSIIYIVSLNYFSNTGGLFLIKYLHYVFNKYLIIIISTIYLFISIFFIINYGIKFRHHGPSISESGYIPILVFTFKIYCTLSLIAIEKIKLQKYLYMYVVYVVLISHILSFTSSTDVLYIIGAFVFILSSKKIKKSNNTKDIFYIFIIGLFTLIGGYVTKVGFDIDRLILLSDILFMNILERLSVHFISLNGIIIDYYSWLQNGFYAFNHDAMSFIYRLGILLGLDVDKPELENISRFNSLQLYFNPRENNGASPGFISISLILQPFILMSIFNFIFNVFLLRCLNIVSINNKFEIKYIMLFPLFLLILEAHYTFLNLISQGFIAIFLILCLTSLIQYEKR